ncbi:MAG: hypothetical protein AAGK09_10455 [Planctomycetota bacterium]
MPVYLFTMHTYGSWLPDRARGYVKRGRGVLEADTRMAGWYRDVMTADVVRWDAAQQRAVVAAVREKCEVKNWMAYAIATDPTHVHALMGWRSRETWDILRRGLKDSITRQLNARFGRQRWLSEGGSRKRVSKPEHFDYLRKVYLPSHRGVCWDADQPSS